MMNTEQRKIVMDVYNHFLDTEHRGWDMLDDYIVYLDFLDNDQLLIESDVIYQNHSSGIARCQQDHEIEKCFIPMLIEAVGAILELYKENGNLHDKNKYILQYYLAMNQSGMIVMEND